MGVAHINKCEREFNLGENSAEVSPLKLWHDGVVAAKVLRGAANMKEEEEGEEIGSKKVRGPLMGTGKDVMENLKVLGGSRTTRIGMAMKTCMEAWGTRISQQQSETRG